MFSVPDAVGAKPTIQTVALADDLKLKKGSSTPAATAPKSLSKQPTAPTAAAKAAPAKTVAPVQSAPQVPASTAAPGKPSPKATPIELPIAEGTDPEVAWNDYFASHPDVHPDQVRETARQLMHERQYARAIAMINAALRNGAQQAWMYEAMSLAMQAEGSSKSQIERALMSAIDFGESAEDLMYVAQYMGRIGLESRALKVFHQVSILEPLRPEPYLYGLQLAQCVNDLDGIKWSSLGILKQAWPRDKNEIVQSAKRAAAAALERLKAENRTSEAAEFQAALDQAKVRDVHVKVTWTGDADVDIMVEEPSGTVCSFRNPRTSGGGVLLGDAASRDARATSGAAAAAGISETYVCPEAFNGTYRLLIRRVWGKVTAGKVTVDVYSHYGSKDEKHVSKQIPLGDQDQAVVFDLQDGRRKEAVADFQLANAAAGQLGVNQAILAQQVNSLANSNSSTASLAASRQGAFGVPFIQQAVGYMPIIITLPAGTTLSVTGVVSADRRYVRISPTPFFTGIGSVTTFNLQTGSAGSTAGSGGSLGSNPGGGAF